MEVSGMKRNYCKSCGKVMNKASTYSEGFCSKCEEEISQRRFDTHKQSKLNRERGIVQSVEAKSKSKETPTFGCCIEHLDKGSICFCLEHNQVCCVDCMLVSHLSCNIEYIFEHIECYEDSEGFSQLKRDIEKNDIEAKAMLGSIRRNKDYVKDVNKKFALDVKLYREEVISHITKLADAMLKHGDDIMAADLEKIKILEKQSKMLVDETNDMRDTLQSDADQPYMFFLTCLSYKKNIHLVHDQLERIKQSNTIETYDFTLDCNLRQLMKTCRQLGTLQRSGNESDYKLREKIVNVPARESRLLEMDNYSASFSDKQDNMEDRSKSAVYKSMAKSTEPPQQKTGIQRREYHPAQTAPAIKWDDETPVSPTRMKSLDLKSGNEFDNKLREKTVHMSANQRRLLEMDNYSASFSDKQDIMEDRSKSAFYNCMAKSTEPPQQKTGIQRREYHPAQAAPAIKWDDETPESPTRMKSLDLKSGNECDNKLREKTVHMSANQRRLMEMDNKLAGNRSKSAIYKSVYRSTEPPQEKTEFQRRKYHQAQASAIKRDDVFPLQSLSSGRMRSLDMKSGNERDNKLREKMVHVSASRSPRWSQNDLEIFKHPMCLISAVNEKNATGKETKILLKREEKVFEQIAKIDWPIVVVAVVGLYRTGKSYLMNRLADSSKGFALGDTIESKTKGIWAWCKIHPKMSNTVLLLLDTEGLGDVEKGDPSHDNKIFTLATLLCNCLVYNMKGAFDNDAVSKLTFVTEIANNIRFRGKSSEDNEYINLILPDFVLCLRDFSLKLIKDGKKISENDYLEQSLAENEGKADQFNKPRACIRKYFKRRACFAFPVPGDGDVLENLETLSFTQLSERFKEVTHRFTSYIYKIPPKNLLASKPINGQMFVTLADRYVTAIKNGAVPDVDEAFTAVAKVENAKVEKEALDIFKNEIKIVILPVSESDLGNYYTNAQNKALHHLRHNVVHDFQAECQIQAQRKMDDIWNKIKTTNEQKVREKCEDTLQKGFVKYLEKNLKSQKYETAGGHRRFQCDVNILRCEYDKVLRKFKENEILSTWYGFLESMSTTEAKIIEADENMSQREKEAEQKRNQENLEALLKQQQRAQEDAFEKQKQNLKDHYEKLENDLREQLEAEKIRYEEFLEEMMEKEEAQKEVERYKMEQEAAQREAARYKRQQADTYKEVMRLRTIAEKRKKKWFGARVWNAFLNN